MPDTRLCTLLLTIILTLALLLLTFVGRPLHLLKQGTAFQYGTLVGWLLNQDSSQGSRR